MPKPNEFRVLGGSEQTLPEKIGYLQNAPEAGLGFFGGEQTLAQCVGTGLPNAVTDDFFTLIQSLTAGDRLGSDALTVPLKFDVGATLRGGLERVLVYAPFFNCLLDLVAAAHYRNGLAAADAMQDARDAEELPQEMCERILAEGLQNIDLPCLIRLVTNPLWLAQLWDALDCLPPFWVRRSEELRQERSFHTVASGWLDVLRSDPPNAEQAFEWLVQHLSPRLRLVLDVKAGGRAADVEYALERTWAALWRDHAGWRAGAEGLEALRAMAVKRLRRRLASPPLPPAPSAEAASPPTTETISDEQLESILEHFPDMPPLDRGLSEARVVLGPEACTTPKVCQNLGLAPKDLTTRAVSFDHVIRSIEHPVSSERR